MSGSEAVSIARKAFKSGRTLPVEWRIKQLKAMQRMVEENEVKLAGFTKRIGMRLSAQFTQLSKNYRGDLNCR